MSDYQNYIIMEFVTESEMKLHHLSEQEYITARKRWADKVCMSLICTTISIKAVFDETVILDKLYLNQFSLDDNDSLMPSYENAHKFC